MQDPRAVEGTARTAGPLSWSGPGGTANPADHALTAGVMNEETATRVTRLETVLPKRTLTNAIGSADRTGAAGCARDPFGPTASQPQLKYCLNDDDSTDPEWIPQGVSGVSDAKFNESWGNAGTDIQVFASYDGHNPGRNNDTDTAKADCTEAELTADDACNEKGVRVTFVKTRTNPVTGLPEVRYQHALLAWTTVSAGRISYYGVASDDSPIQDGIHAGGIVWYGDFLYVADTRNGIRVFDVQRILDLDPDGNPATRDAMGADTDGAQTTANVQDTTKVGRHGNVWYSYGYRYIIPQVAAWRFKAPQSNPDNNNTHTCASTGAPKASYLSLDREPVPDRLIMGEYCRPTAEHPSTGRIASYPVAALEARSGDVPAQNWSNYLPVPGYVQGVAALGVRNKLYINVSRGKTQPGHLHRAQWDAGGILSTTGAPVPTAAGTEALYIERGNNRLWSVSEYAPQEPGCTTLCQRVLYAHDLTWLDGQP